MAIQRQHNSSRLILTKKEPALLNDTAFTRQSQVWIKSEGSNTKLTNHSNMNPPTSTYAQNLRLRKIQNRRHNGQDKFNIGKRGEPIPGELDPVTIARRQRRALKRPVNLKKRIKKIENAIMWENRQIDELTKILKEKKDQKLQAKFNQHQLEVQRLQIVLLNTQQSIAALS